jgi:hypothetical protein
MSQSPFRNPASAGTVLYSPIRKTGIFRRETMGQNMPKNALLSCIFALLSCKLPKKRQTEPCAGSVGSDPPAPIGARSTDGGRSWRTASPEGTGGGLSPAVSVRGFPPAEHDEATGSGYRQRDLDHSLRHRYPAHAGATDLLR